MQSYSSPILLIPVNALLSASTKIFPRFAGSEKERESQYEFGHSLQRRDGVKKTRRQIVWNGFLESSISDPGNFPQGRQTYPFSRALLHTSMYKIVFPKLDPLKDRKRVQTYYLFVQAMNQPPGSAW